MSNTGPLDTNSTGAFERECAGCGTAFRTNYPRQRYCSNRCKRRAQNRRAYQRRKTRRKKK